MERNKSFRLSVVDIFPKKQAEVLKKVIKNDNFADNDYYLEQYHGKK